jgi:hypothetical protein
MLVRWQFICLLSSLYSADAMKRGLVGGSCNQSRLFLPSARSWHYDYNVALPDHSRRLLSL